MSLDRNFQAHAGHAANIIPNLQAAGAIIREFFEITWRDSFETQPQYEYYDLFEDGGEDVVFIKFETTAEDVSYEGYINLSPHGTLSLSVTTFDEEDMVIDTAVKEYPLWITTDPDNIAHQVIKTLADDPDSILTVTGVVFFVTYERLLAEAKQQLGIVDEKPEEDDAPPQAPAATPPAQTPETPAEPSAGEEPAKKGGWGWGPFRS